MQPYEVSRKKSPPRHPARTESGRGGLRARHACAPHECIVRVPMSQPKPCDESITIPGIFTLICGCRDPHPARHLGTVWHITEDSRHIMQYAKRYVRSRREKGFTDEQSVAAQRAAVICYGAWVRSVWDIPKPVQPQLSCSSMLTWGLLTVRTGYAYQPPACCTYRMHRAACPGRHALYVRGTRPSLGVLYVPRTVAPQVAVPVRHPRGGGRPAGGAASDPDPGVRGAPEDRAGARQRQRRAPSRGYRCAKRP